MQVWFQRKPATTATSATATSPGIEVTMKIFVPDMETDEAQLMEKLTCLLLHKVYKKVNDYIQSL
jgi:hypothetical protein